MARVDSCDSTRDVADRLYRNTQILAPMVRASTLPLRRLALKHGADTVYTEEIIDHKLLRVERIENKKLQTVDFVMKSQNSDTVKSTQKVNMDKRLVLRLHPGAERGRLVLQIGTNDAVRALRGVQHFARDISAVDINMCCPKHFSISGGMGCALLRKPETACDIIRTLRRNLSIPVSCKMRMLDASAGERIDCVASEQIVRTTSVTAMRPPSPSSKVVEEVSSSPGTNRREKIAAAVVPDLKTTPSTTIVPPTLKRGASAMANARASTPSATATLQRKKQKKSRRNRKKKGNTDIGTLLAIEDLDEAVRSTARFMRQMEAAGAAAVAVHLRTASERRENPAHLETSTLRTLSSCVRVPFIVNGDAFSRETAKKIQSTVPGCSIMYARGALRNPSIFRRDGALPRDGVVKEYVEEAVRFENHYQNTKYVVMHSMKEVGDTKSAQWKRVSSARSNADICAALGMDFSSILRIRDDDDDDGGEAYEDGHTYNTTYFGKRT